MQFQLPQFIETEDKIVGPFSLKQFIYIAAAGGFSFLLFFTVNTWLAGLLSVFLVGSALALAFLRINGRPLSGLIVSAFSYYWKPQTYVWQSENPAIKKEEITRSSGLQDIVAGLFLKNAWMNLQTGTKTSAKKSITQSRERYQIFQRFTGERKASRRVDYR